MKGKESNQMREHCCRFCKSRLDDTMIDLGMSPLANSYISKENEDMGQMTYPLHVRVCKQCFLVQLDEFESPRDIFEDYAYFSSYSQGWLAHAKKYTEHMMEHYGIGADTRVIEIASNDGYLLQYFKEKGVPVLGIEPAANVAKIAVGKGIETVIDFFGTRLAEQLVKEEKKADLLLGNNVLAHVPDINDFVEGMRIILADDGILTMEFPHVLHLIEKAEFDTIYHEHFSYLSLYTVRQIFAAHGLRVFHVETLPTHGGSIRVYACRETSSRHALCPSVDAILAEEEAHGLQKLGTYTSFSEKARKIKYDLLDLLIECKRAGKCIVGYGAAAKGNTLLNFCGIGTEFLDFIVDKNPYKQNTLLPGSRIPVLEPSEIEKVKADYVLILPWNLTDEIVEEMACIREWGGHFIVPIPSVKVL